MIDSFDIRVPSVVETEGDFVVEVRALDALGNILVSDSTSVVELISSDPNIVFDGDENGTYGEPGDNQKILTNGIALFNARDIKSGTFIVNVEDTQNNTGSKEFIYSFNCLVLPYRPTEPPVQGTENAAQFFRPRNSVLPGVAGVDIPTRGSSLVPVSASQTLQVKFDQALIFRAQDIVQGTGTPVEDLPNTEGDLVPTQSVGASQATFNDNEIKGNPVLTFDGNDFYSVENADDPLIQTEADFTVSAIVRLLQSGGVQTIFSQYEEAADNGKIVFRYNNGFEILLGSDGNLGEVSVSTPAQSISTPLLVSFERKGDVFTIRVNDVLLASTTELSSRQILQAGNLIGARSSSGTFEGTPTDFFPSDLMSLKVLKGTPTALNRLKTLYEFEDEYGDPLANTTPYITSIQTTYGFDRIYPHDDPSLGGFVRDVSGNGVNGVQIGVSPQQSPLLTDGGQSFEFGPSQIVSIPSIGLTAAAGRTYHFWIASDEVVGSALEDQYLFDHQSPRIALFWEVDSGGVPGNIALFDTTYRDFGVSLPRGGVATLVTFVFSGSTAELYLNGVSQSSIASTTNGRSTLSGDVILGARFSADASTSAQTYKQDAVMIINEAQTGPEILAIYNAGIA